MIKFVEFMSMAAAEKLAARADCAVISITSPGDAQAQLQTGWRDVLRLQFHDIDLADDSGHTLFSEDDARRVIEFVDSNAPEVTGLIVHCHAGISRSAAIAKYVADTYALRFPQSYSIYNKAIYRRLNSLRWEDALRNS